jgi:hypothetical protein
MRLLQRSRAARNINIVPGGPGIGESIFGPSASNDLCALLEAGLSGVAIEPMLEIISRHPTTQPHVQPSAGEDV